MEVKIGETQTELTLQHFDYGSLIGGRRLSSNCILKFGEFISHMYTIVKQNLAEHAGVEFADNYFIKWQQIVISKEFHKREIEIDNPITYVECLKRKFKILHHCLPIKKSTQQHCFAGFDIETDTLLFVSSVVAVNVDWDSKRAEPFPKFMRDHYTSERCETPPWLKTVGLPKCQTPFDFRPIEDRFHVRKCPVSIRQIGRLGYTTQSALVEICTECLGEALEKSVFGNIGSIFERKVGRISVMYLGISIFTDTLETYVWQDDIGSSIFKFHVKKASIVVCQVETELYPAELKPDLQSKL